MDGGIHATKLDFLSKPKQVNLKGLFGELSKVIAKVAGGTIAHKPDAIISALPDFFGAITSVIVTSEEERAYILVERAIANAVAQLGIENRDIFHRSLVADTPFTFAEAEDIPLVLAPDFLQRPREIGILANAQPLLKEWLIANGTSEIQASTTSERLPTYFALSLHEELTRHAEFYLPLTKRLKGDTAPLALEAWVWERYRAELIRESDRPLFDEAFGLRRVFVPLRAFWKQKQNNKEKPGRTEEETKHEVLLVETLRKWASGGDRNDTLRILSGDPGGGKSSCAKMWAAEMAEDHPGWRVVFVPLHRFDFKGVLSESLKTYLKTEARIDADLLDRHCPDNVLLFFDGLDELAMQGKSAREAAVAFVRQVNMILLHTNSEKRRVLAGK